MWWAIILPDSPTIGGYLVTVLVTRAPPTYLPHYTQISEILSLPQLKRCRALFDFKPMDASEMPLKEGQEVSIIDDSDTNWWKGCCNGKQGLFPANYVALLE